jgi:type II secretory pathway component GspD/PulD (secretin)
MFMNLSRLLATVLAAVALLTAVGPLAAQSEDEARQEALRKAMEARKAAAAGAQPDSEAKSPGSTPDGDKKDADKPGEKPKDADEKKEAQTPKVVTRPEAEQGQSVDMAVLRQQVGRDGMVRFNLEGVPWPDLLRWLADASSLSLDWQTLPGDALNLRTQRPYSIEEARDVINRHLLARGYTMLRHGELLSVVKIEDLNPGLVPRVRPEDLDDRLPHEFVKVSFPLDWLIAEKAVEELKPMLSPNGKLTALSATNRLEAVDAVVNLMEIRTVLNEEQTESDDNRVVRIFRLQHVPAAEAVALVEQILGLENNRSISGSIDNNASQMIMQQLQQMQRNMQQSSGGSKGGGGKAESDEPKLIVNQRDNSIVAHAPPDKMEIINQTITALDTPAGRQGRATHTKIFRLSTLDPVPLVSIVKELGDFSPNTKIQADETNNSLIVQGSLVDLNSVYELVQQLDGSTRNFEVIPLRRLAADEVAGTIQYLMGSEEKEDNSRNRGYYSYYSYGFGSSRGGRDSKEEKRPFKVDADIENNRLLLWANEVELEEVQNLLVKMGEIPAGEGSNETLRVIDLSTDEDAERVLERIRQMWPNLAPNQLQIQPPAGRSVPPAETRTAPSAASPPADEAGESDTGDDPLRMTDSGVHPSHPLLVVETGQSVALFQTGVQPEFEDPSDRDAAAAEPVPPPVAQRSQQRPDEGIAVPPGSRSAPPIAIHRGPDGRLIISSPDTRALDQLEAMMADMAPPRRDYHIFRLQYPNTWAYGIELTLKDFFKDDIQGGEPTLDWWGGVVNRRDSTPSRLSKRRSLKIISDEDSRTLLVQGATPSQLQTISDLIEIYDQPTSSDPQALRTTKFFKLKYSSAEIIADTLKAVYRDLLSTNDPALRDPNGNKEDRPQNSGTTLTYVYNRGNTGEEDSGGKEPSRITFKGLISVGVDSISNTLVVSSIEGLMPEITEIVETLDEAARPAGNFQVISLDPSINPAAVQARLQKLLQAQRQQQQPGNGNQNGNQQPGNGGNNNGGNGPGGGFGGPGR